MSIGAQQPVAFSSVELPREEGAFFAGYPTPAGRFGPFRGNPEDVKDRGPWEDPTLAGTRLPARAPITGAGKWEGFSLLCFNLFCVVFK